MTHWLHRFSIRHPVLVLVLAVLAVAAVAPGVVKLRLRTDGQALVPEQDAAVQLDRRVRREFGIHDPIVVLLRPRHADGIVNSRTLQLVADLTRDLGMLPGLDSTAVSSLATEPSDRLRRRSLVYRKLLEPIPATRRQLDQFRGDLDAFDLLTGTLVSADRAATAILVSAPPREDRSGLVGAIRAVVAAADTAGHQIDVIGAPVAEALLGAHVLDDLGVRAGPRVTRDSGALSALGALRVWIARHVGLLPLSIAIMAIVFLIGFRSVAATLLPLGEAAACLAFVFGAMGWAGVPMYLTMAVLPVILVSMGLADEIHVFTHYSRHRLARPTAPVAEVVRAAMDETCLPVIATAATTAIGFLSFALSPLAPVRAFGVFTAIGIAFCMLWTLTAIPALLVLLAPRPFRAAGAARGEGEAFAPGRWAKFGARLGRWPVVTLLLVAAGLALCEPGIRRLTVQDGWISGFARDSDFFRATRYFNQHFFGTHRLLLVLDAGHVEHRTRIAGSDLTFEDIRLPSGWVGEPATLVGCSLIVSRRAAAVPAAQSGFVWYRPDVWGSVVDTAIVRDGRVALVPPLVTGSPLFLLAPEPRESLDVVVKSHRFATHRVMRQIELLERFVDERTDLTVGGVLGPPDWVAMAEFITNQRDPQWREVPRELGRVAWLWEQIGNVRGDRDVRAIVDSTFRRGVVTVFLKDANYRDTARLMQALRDYEREHLTPARIGLEFAGDVAVSQALIDSIVRSQLRSLLGSLLGILVVTALLFRSLRYGFACVLPAAIAVAFTFAVMGFTGTPLGVATSMFAAMVLGVGVDFAIHVAERFRLARARGVSRETGVAEALSVTGPAIVLNALAIALGFGLLTLSRVPANGWLGGITVLSLTGCLAATFVVLPALLRLGRPERAAGQ